MEQKSFLKRTLIPVLLAVLLVTAIQLIPRQFPAAALPASLEGYTCQVSLLADGTPAQTLALAAEDAAVIYDQLRAARVQSRGPAEDVLPHYPILYRVTFTPAEEGEAYELFLDPWGRLFSTDKLYQLQGGKPRAIAETLQDYLDASTGATGVITP